jgi:hypothetical protein
MTPSLAHSTPFRSRRSLAKVSTNSGEPHFCDDLEARTHDVATVQEIILTRVFERLGPQSRDAVAILCLADIPLARAEAAALLAQTNGLGCRRQRRAPTMTSGRPPS